MAYDPNLVQTKATIAALRANVAPTPVIYVQGYYAGSDGGEGEFWLNTADTTSADNGGTVIVDGAGHRYYRETDGDFWSAKWFGATGDGVTDDTSAITAWQNALSTTGTRSLTGYVPAGSYLISATIPWQGGMVGQSGSTAIFLAGPSLNTHMFDTNYGSFGKRLDGITIDLRSAGASATAFGSSSTGGAGGSALVDVGYLFIRSSSTTTYALDMPNSSVAEVGMFTGSSFSILQISAPLPMRVGTNHDDINVSVMRLDNAAGGTSTPTVVINGSDFLCGTLYYGYVDITGGTFRTLFLIGPNSVTFQQVFLEPVGVGAYANLHNFFQALGGGLVSNPQGSLQIGHIQTYGPVASVRAYIRGNVPTTEGYTYSVAVGGVQNNVSGSALDVPLVEVFNGLGTGPSGTLRLAVKNCDQLSHLVQAAPSSQSSGTLVQTTLSGWWRNIPLNHGAPSKTTGFLTFSPINATALSNNGIVAPYTSLTWTPTDASGAGLVFTNVFASYTRLQSEVILRLRLTFPATADTSAVVIGGLPLVGTASTSYTQGTIAAVASSDGTARWIIPTAVSSSTVSLFDSSIAAAVQNVTMSGRTMRFELIYHVDV